MTKLRTLLLAGTVISAAALAAHPAPVLAASAGPVLAQAETPPAEVPPEEQRKRRQQEQQKQKQDQRQQRQQRQGQRQEQKQEQPKQNERQQRQQQRQEQKQDQRQEQRQQRQQQRETPPAERQTPKSEQAPPADMKQERRRPDQNQEQDRRQERRDRTQDQRDRKGDTPPVPPVPPRGDAPPAPEPEAPSTVPAPPPPGEKPAVPPEELKGGASTPEQRQRRQERVERDFKNRDKKLDQRFGRKVEEQGNRTIIREGDNRVIVRDGDRVIIRSDETERFRRNARDVRQERGRNDETTTVVIGPGGVEIVTVKDRDGNLIRRSRRHGGKETVLIDNRRAWERGGRWDRDRGWRDRDRNRDGLNIDFYLDLPPVRIGIPEDDYIIYADRGSYDDFEETFLAPPLMETERPYSLQEVTQNVRLRERVRSVDLNTVTFATAEWRVADDQIPQLEDIARAMKALIDRDPTQVYLIEGHTDAVGSNIDNLSLSDRRAEEVAWILTEYYQIPAENLVTQGYGEDYLRVNTEAANERNRRVTIRNITELLNVQQSQAQ